MQYASSMSLAVVKTRAAQGLDAPLVSVEVDLAKGLPGFTIVGLPATGVKESKDRVKSALINSGFEFPVAKIIVNLAPADLPKQGGRFDLAIAIGILAATNQVPMAVIERMEFIGELALDGQLRVVNGVLPVAISAAKAGHPLMVPVNNAQEAALAKEAIIYPASHILDVAAHLNGQKQILPYHAELSFSNAISELDLSDVKGQPFAKQALEVAAAGGHSLLLCGPPGSGKTMLAQRFMGLLPALTEEQALAIASIATLSKKGFDLKQWGRRPFRHPHHTASSAALVGGGNPPHPGEISLAHHGVLFLDELPEFSRHVLETLREPLESNVISIARSKYQVEFPADFQLIAAMNPCPCGFLNDPGGRCRCTAEQVQRYQTKISGPLLDRIDLQVEVAPVAKKALLSEQVEPSSAVVRERVVLAQERQLARQAKLNAMLLPNEIKQHCRLMKDTQAWLLEMAERLNLSARTFDRLLKVTRTVADLADSDTIEESHLATALSFQRRAI